MADRIDTDMAAFMEAIDQPLLLVAGLRILHANRPALALLGAHIAGQDIRLALRHPDVVELIAESAGGEAVVTGLSTPASVWEVKVAPIAGEMTLIGLRDRTAQADVSRAHTDFVANASHELRTPLSAIIGYAETLMDEKTAADAATRTRFLGIVRQEASRLQRLVEDLMSLSRIEAERHDLPQVKLDLVRQVRSIVGEIAAAGDSPGTLTISAGEEEAIVAADAGQISQLLRNLVDNAVKYGGAGKPVTVSIARDRSGRVVLSVADEGDGIPAEHLPRVTERFFRVDAARSRAAGGTGLGLAIVKHIVQRHRGQLDIRSRAGAGTTVSVAFPAA